MEFDSLVPEASEYKEPEAVEDSSDPLFNDADSPWLWNGSETFDIPEEAFSFVYRITNLRNGKFYIGYKGLFSKKIKIVNKKRKHLLVESDWKKYWSSGENLKIEISNLGKGNFKREILAFCPMKGVGKYVELFLQLYYGVLTYNKEKTYNGIVNVRLSSRTVTRYKDVILCDELKNLKI